MTDCSSVIAFKYIEIEWFPHEVAVTLQEDPLNCTIFREEAIVTIITSLNAQISRDKSQANLARALLILGGRFSCTGEPTIENWLLQQAGFKETSGDSFHSKHMYDDFVQSVSFVSKSLRFLLENDSLNGFIILHHLKIQMVSMKRKRKW